MTEVGANAIWSGRHPAQAWVTTHPVNIRLRVMYQLIALILQPFLLLFVLTLVACANLWRERKEKRTRLLLLTLPLVGLTAMCIPPVGYLALGSLEWQYPPLREYPTDVGAIVVLAGGIIPPDEVQRRAELSPSTFYRCLHARELYQENIRARSWSAGGRSIPRNRGHRTPKRCEIILSNWASRPRTLSSKTDRERLTKTAWSPQNCSDKEASAG